MGAWAAALWLPFWHSVPRLSCLCSIGLAPNCQGKAVADPLAAPPPRPSRDRTQRDYLMKSENFCGNWSTARLTTKPSANA